MSLHSVDDHEPSSSTPVFGGTVSQTKLQQPTNDLDGAEKLTTPQTTLVNGENETINAKTSDSAQSVNGNNSTVDTHVNGQKNANSTVEQVSTSDSVGKDKDQEAAPAAPDPVLLSSSADVAQNNVTSASAPIADNAPPETVAPTSTTSNDNVPALATAPEATVLAEERKTRSPRGKAKTPAIITPPTRQSTRARKPVTTTNIDDSNDDEEEEEQQQKVQTKTTPKRGKRQTKEKPQPTPKTDAANEEEPVAQPPEVEETKSIKTPSPRKGGNAGQKRGASTSPVVSNSKKVKTTPKGTTTTTPTNDEQAAEVKKTEEISTPTKIEIEPVQTPPAKKARTSANRKTPTTTTTTTPEPADEYVRKLRPRK